MFSQTKIDIEKKDMIVANMQLCRNNATVYTKGDSMQALRDTRSDRYKWVKRHSLSGVYKRHYVNLRGYVQLPTLSGYVQSIHSGVKGNMFSPCFHSNHNIVFCQAKVKQNLKKRNEKLENGK